MRHDLCDKLSIRSVGNHEVIMILLKSRFALHIEYTKHSEVNFQILKLISFVYTKLNVYTTAKGKLCKVGRSQPAW